VHVTYKQKVQSGNLYSVLFFTFVLSFTLCKTSQFTQFLASKLKCVFKYIQLCSNSSTRVTMEHCPETEDITTSATLLLEDM